MIDINGSGIFRYEISYLIANFVMLLSLSEFKTVFEFFMYAGRDTHRFMRQYYKNSFRKRELMLTVFDETLVNESKYKKQMQAIFWSNVAFKALTLILFILRCIFTFKGSIPIWFAVINLPVFAAWLIFVFWVHAHRIDDWRGWIKPMTYSRDFSMRLPDEKPKKKTKKK